MQILFLEPYDGGSHESFRLNLVQRSKHDITCLTMPARNWKWRMRGAAAWLADRINESGQDYDLIFATDFLNIADLRGLLQPPLDRCPLVLYMHENQLTYPLSPDEEFDFHFGFTNIISQLAADHVLFNSEFHRRLFLDSLPDYLARMPDGVPAGIRPRLEAKSRVLPVGLESAPHGPDYFAPWLGGVCDPEIGPGWPRNGREPVILWNHRWEFDKRPQMFTSAMLRLAQAGLPFRLLLLGETRQQDDVFSELHETLGDRIDAYGWQPDRETYQRHLAAADIVVSCAAQEYFGISVAEAIHAGAYAVLPREQVYPSLYGALCKGRHFYRYEDELVVLLTDLLAGRDTGHVCSLPVDCDRFCWDRLITEYDTYMDEVCRSHDQ
jgi:glycosyltransferase involved in cell wall biosynthesis